MGERDSCIRRLGMRRSGCERGTFGRSKREIKGNATLKDGRKVHALGDSNFFTRLKLVKVRVSGGV